MLINSLAKLFWLYLRNRLNAWCEQAHIYTESQFGLNAVLLIQNIVSLNKKVFCAFIDYGVWYDFTRCIVGKAYTNRH